MESLVTIPTLHTPLVTLNVFQIKIGMLLYTIVSPLAPRIGTAQLLSSTLTYQQMHFSTSCKLNNS